MSRYTDDLITISKEDYNLAVEKNFKCNIRHINGMGVNTNKYFKVSDEYKSKLRKELGYKDEFIILCTGELNKNKNQGILIKSLIELTKEHNNIKLLLAGNGPEYNNLVNSIKENNLNEKITLIGYRTDLENYVKISDLVVSASIREGLGLNILEAMTCGKAIVEIGRASCRERV